MDWNLAAFIVTTLVTVSGAAYGLARHQSGEFSKIKNYVFEQSEKILNKLEYHERHDDERFGRISNDIWELRLAQAVRGISGSKESSPDRGKTSEEASS